MVRKIVVIDDDAVIVALYDELLTEAGYEVVGTFARPPDDVHSIAMFQPDLIMLDWIFGQEASGMQFLDRLAGAPSTATIPVVVCSAAKTTLTEVERILTQRGVHVVYKPFHVDDLLHVIQQVVGRDDTDASGAS